MLCIDNLRCVQVSVIGRSEAHIVAMSQKLDPLWHAMSKLRRAKYDECIAICDEMLSINPGDQVNTVFYSADSAHVWLFTAYLFTMRAHIYCLIFYESWWT